MQIFCDMDGVLADFDTGYGMRFGVPPSKADDNVDWELVRNTPNFYRDLPTMPGIIELWGYIRNYKPIILTGVPHSVEEAPANKRAWVDKWLGTNVPMIACKSAEKRLYMTGYDDILIDDWPKYRALWLEAGGRWVTHVNAATTILRLQDMGI